MKPLFLSILSCTALTGCGPDIQSQNANSFVVQLYLGMSAEAYWNLRDSFYPPIPEGTVLGGGCFGRDIENQECITIRAPKHDVFDQSFTRQYLIEECAKFTCYPNNLPELLTYDPESGESSPVADTTLARFANWGTWDGRMLISVFVDPEKRHLIGLMLEGDFDETEIRFPKN